MLLKCISMQHFLNPKKNDIELKKVCLIRCAPEEMVGWKNQNSN